MGREELEHPQLGGRQGPLSGHPVACIGAESSGPELSSHSPSTIASGVAGSAVARLSAWLARRTTSLSRSAARASATRISISYQDAKSVSLAVSSHRPPRVDLRLVDASVGRVSPPTPRTRARRRVLGEPEALDLCARPCRIRARVRPVAFLHGEQRELSQAERLDVRRSDGAAAAPSSSQDARPRLDLRSGGRPPRIAGSRSIAREGGRRAESWARVASTPIRAIPSAAMPALRIVTAASSDGPESAGAAVLSGEPPRTSSARRGCGHRRRADCPRPRGRAPGAPRLVIAEAIEPP